MRATASKLWHLMPEFREFDEPKWSSGWLWGFQKRYRVKQFKQHGEAGSVDRLEAEERMNVLRSLSNEYDSDNIYNADETGFSGDLYRIQHWERSSFRVGRLRKNGLLYSPAVMPLGHTSLISGSLESRRIPGLSKVTTTASRTYHFTTVTTKRHG